MVLLNNRLIKIIEMIFIIPIIRLMIRLIIKLKVLLMTGTVSKLSTCFQVI